MEDRVLPPPGSTWFGLHVWPSKEKMVEAGVKAGPYYVTTKKGQRKIKYGVLEYGKETNANSLLPVLKYAMVNEHTTTPNAVHRALGNHFFMKREVEELRRKRKERPSPHPRTSQTPELRETPVKKPRKFLTADHYANGAHKYASSAAKARFEQEKPDDLERVNGGSPNLEVFRHRLTGRVFVKTSGNASARPVKTGATTMEKQKIEQIFPSYFRTKPSPSAYEAVRHTLTGRLFRQRRGQPSTRELVVRPTREKSPIVNELKALGMRVWKSEGRGKTFQGFFASPKTPLAVKFKYNPPDGTAAILDGAEVLARFKGLVGFKRVASPWDRMLTAAHQILEDRQREKQTVDNIVRRRQNARNAYAQNIKGAGSPGGQVLNIKNLQTHLKSMFDVTGLYKPNWKSTGVAGAFTEKSLNVQLAEWSSDTPPDGCTFTPWRILGKVTYPIMPHQAVVHVMAHLRAQDQIKTPGLLAYHSTGSGKTLETLIVMLQFWYKKRPKGDPWAIFFCSVRSNQTGNSVLDLADLARKHFPYFQTSPGVYGFGGDRALAYETLAERIIRGYMGILSSPRHQKEWLTKAHLSSNETDRKAGYRTYIEALRTFKSPSFDSSPVAEKQRVKKAMEKGQKGEARLLSTYTTFINDAHMFEGVKKVDVAAQVVVTTQAKVSHAVWILDEVQFLIGSPSSTERGYINEYRTALKLLTAHRHSASTWVFASTATPGTSQAQFLGILNLVRTGSVFKNVSDVTLSNAGGLISFVDMTGNRAQFASYDIIMECVDLWSNERYGRKYFESVITLSHIPAATRKSLIIMFQEMNQKAFNKNHSAKLIVSKRLKNQVTGETHLVPKNVKTQNIPPQVLAFNIKSPNSNPAAFYRHLRVKSMFLPFRLKEKRAPQQIFQVHEKFKPAVYTVLTDNVNGARVFAKQQFAYIIGPKIALLLRRIKSNPRSLHYVYVRDKMSLLIIAYLLTRDLDLTLFGKPGGRGSKGTFGFVNQLDSTQKKDKFTPFNSWSLAEVNRVIAAASSGQNATGQVVRVLLGSKEAFKGVDVKNIRHLHLLDAMADFQHFLQFIGRGPRFCAHARFRQMSSRHVKIHVYRVSHGLPGTRNVKARTPHTCPATDDAAVFADCHVWKQSWDHYQKEWGDLRTGIQRVAVDAKIFEPTFHRAVNKIYQGLHERMCLVQTVKVSNSEKVRNRNIGNNNSNYNNVDVNINATNSNSNAFNGFSGLRRIPLERLNANYVVNTTKKQTRARASNPNLMRKLVNDVTPWVREYVQLQQKWAKNGLSNTNAARLLVLQQKVKQNKVYKGLVL
jgi:hypothetical protein